MTNAYCCPICQATYRQNCRACGMVYVPRWNSDDCFWVDRRTNQRVHTADSMWAFEAKMISAEEIDRGSRRIASPQFSTVTSTDLSKHAVSATYLDAVESFRAEMQDALQFFQAQQDNSAIYKQINDALTPPSEKPKSVCKSCDAPTSSSFEVVCSSCLHDEKARQIRKKELNRGFEDFRYYVKNGKTHRHRITCTECGVDVAEGRKLCSDCVEDAWHRAKMKASCDPCGSDVVMQELADAMANRDVTEAKDAIIPSWDPLNAAPMLHWLPTPPEPEVFPRFAGGDKMTVALGVALALGSLFMAGFMVLMGLWWVAPLWLAPTLYCAQMERRDRQAKIQRYYDAIHRRATADWENGRHEVLKEHQS